ncbi:4Fe-4S single cluster domain-containing protein [Micromonospora sp. DT48]|uniref:4Fe-4S single cluster domain-containing protein n=1 Tax=unclassified Micromonospora TaxID=2617518 RepID=UPI0013290DBD|nr:4Fe-4S single cluster domain-containing protein [Micromonospora sp. CP22]MTK04221.1 radical SAM protein [Micromonospora sp. CP22]
MTTTLEISRVVERTAVLGPGLRAVIWVRGCPLRCPGCVAPEDLPFTGGTTRTVDDLAEWLGGLPPEITGVTFSGGEPMSQAAGLSALVTRVRADRDWSVMAYSGWTMEHLRRRGEPDHLRLLDQLDILVDGPYVAARHADLRWRGSANQRLHFLTDRHAPPPEDGSAGIELRLTDDGVQWIGVPPVPGFRTGFETAMRTRGITIAPSATSSDEKGR